MAARANGGTSRGDRTSAATTRWLASRSGTRSQRSSGRNVSAMMAHASANGIVSLMGRISVFDIMRSIPLVARSTISPDGCGVRPRTQACDRSNADARVQALQASPRGRGARVEPVMACGKQVGSRRCAGMLAPGLQQFGCARRTVLWATDRLPTPSEVSSPTPPAAGCCRSCLRLRTVLWPARVRRSRQSRGPPRTRAGRR